MSSIIGIVGRRSLKVRALNIFIHFILICGAVTMIYPFLIMLSGSVKSSVDYKNFETIPSYFYNDNVLFQKYLCTKYNDTTGLLKRNLKSTASNIEKFKKPELTSEGFVADFRDFAQNEVPKLGSFFYTQGMVNETGVYPLELRNFRAWLQNKYGKGEDGIIKLNNKVGSEYRNWDSVRGPSEDFFIRRSFGNYQDFMGEFQEFKVGNNDTLTRFYLDIDGFFAEILQRDCARTLPEINRNLGVEYKSWQDITVSESLPKNPKLAKIWETFVRSAVNLQFLSVEPSAIQDYRQFLISRYNNDISILNKSYGTSYKDFSEIQLVKKVPTYGNLLVDWNDFISEKAPIDKIHLKGLSYYYREFLKNRYNNDLSKLNTAHNRGFKSFSEITLSDSIPENNAVMHDDWNEFLNSLQPSEIKLKKASSIEYKKYIGTLYKDDKTGKIDYAKMASDYSMKISGDAQIPNFMEFPAKASQKAKDDYISAAKSPKIKDMRIIKKPAALQNKWLTFLKNRYNGKIENLNLKYGFTYTSFDTVPILMHDWEWAIMEQNKSKLMVEYLYRNYAMVLDTILFNGYAGINTVIYCILAIITALIVNPLAAYALSRYNPPSTYKILLLLMLTMAFPPMVLGIPNFLMIKNLGLLNTFAALILPGVASGYSIFLLKGFFDSLPKELFECATLDGANEWTMFWQIAMTLSKPILAVIALGAFTSAYSNFMMAFLVCQDPKMWTIMVYLYQLQQRSSQAVGFAALVIAAVPTFLVFIFCQNIIIKGIVVPTEK